MRPTRLPRRRHRERPGAQVHRTRLPSLWANRGRARGLSGVVHALPWPTRDGGGRGVRDPCTSVQREETGMKQRRPRKPATPAKPAELPPPSALTGTDMIDGLKKMSDEDL